jgi:hypothetical protein
VDDAVARWVEDPLGRKYRNAPIRAFGSYGYQMAVGFVEPDPHYGFTGRSLMGLPMGPHYLYGSFRSAEGSRFYYLLKQLYPFAGVTSLVCSRDEGDFEPVVEASQKGYLGDVGRGERRERYGVWNRALPGAPDFHFLTDGRSSVLRESDILSLEGEVLGDAMQLAIPDAESPLVYTSHNYRAEGRVCGEPVAGFYSQDHLHLQPGHTWLEAEFFNRVEGLFAVFITTYEDGGWDKGTLICGREDFNCALIQRSSGENIAATDVDYTWELGDDDFVCRCRVTIAADEVWEFVPRYANGGPRSPLPPILGGQGPGYSLQGVVTKVGEGRPWVDSDANLETYPTTLKDLGRMGTSEQTKDRFMV